MVIMYGSEIHRIGAVKKISVRNCISLVNHHEVNPSHELFKLK